MSEPDLSHLLLTAFRSLDAEIGRGLQDRGVSDLRPSQAAALLVVDRAGTRLTDLARRAGITKQAMMQMVDELESLGCVRRTKRQDGPTGSAPSSSRPSWPMTSTARSPRLARCGRVWTVPT